MHDDSLDKVGLWTEIKLKIIKEYASAYAKILESNKRTINKYGYIDGFAGAGMHRSKTTGEIIEGSPIIALKTKFSHYHFIDLDGKRIEYLEKIRGSRQDVDIHQGDCNKILISDIFPKYSYEDYNRALCLLDPYNINPNWEVVQKAGKMRSIEIFLNFMIMDMNMNVLKKNPDNVLDSEIKRMDEFWGDNSWKKDAYQKSKKLFDDLDEKTSNEIIVKAYQKRLKDVAGYKYVLDPIPMKNENNAVIYYLFFASNKEAGAKIAKSIFKKYNK